MNEEKHEAYAFRLREHFTRWFESMKMMRFSVPYSAEELEEALRQRAAELADALARLARDGGLRQRLGNEGRSTIERDFDLRTNVAKLVTMFEAGAA